VFTTFSAESTSSPALSFNVLPEDIHDVFGSLSLFGRTLRSVSTSSGSSTMRPLRVGDRAQVAMALDPILTCKLWSTASEYGCLLGGNAVFGIVSITVSTRALTNIVHLNAQTKHYVGMYYHVLFYQFSLSPSLSCNKKAKQMKFRNGKSFWSKNV